MPAAITMPGNTTAQNAEIAAKRNAELQQEQIDKRNEEKAKLNPRKDSPLTVRARKYSLRDPDTGKHLPAGELVTLPFAGGWLRSQIDADLVEVVDGDASVPVEDNPPPDTNINPVVAKPATPKPGVPKKTVAPNARKAPVTPPVGQPAKEEDEKGNGNENDEGEGSGSGEGSGNDNNEQ